MFSPTYVQLKYWFYPIGNTPAVNLLRDIPACQGEETIKILSLACGDPRNVLFSLWCERGHNTKRTVSFTCCDIEPAILARNVVLLTLITRGRQITELWDLFYHFYVPPEFLSILRTHAADLVEASKSTEQWASSPYGKYIQYVDKATLQELRRYWTRYASMEEFPQARTAIAQRSKEIGSMQFATGIRSAGPFWFNAMETMGYVYREFWKTGVVAGNSDDLSRLNGKGEVNPMFAVSSAASRDFAVHYGAEPLLGFHLPEAFQEEIPKKRGAASELAKRAVAIAKSQFKAWCENFSDYVSNDRVHVSFFCGEALALSHDLQLAITLDQKRGHVARTYVKPWSACPLLLDGNVNRNASGDLHCDPFHVIDTSNVGDHVGFINILSATAPLLLRNASSVLYTESLLMASKEVSASLSTLLGSDVATFSLLIGLAPSGLLTGVTLDAVSNETALFTFVQGDTNRQKQYRLRVSWKHPQYSDPSVVGLLGSSTRSDLQVRFEAKDLADYLFDIYKTMFAHEDLSKLTAQVARMSVGQFSPDLQRYTRAGMAALLRLVRATVQVDWEQTMHLFENHLDTDRSLIVGSNSLQELYMHLHISGAWTNKCLQSSPNQLRSGFGLSLRPASGEYGILAADNSPSVVQLVLVVPREKLTVFTGKTPDAIGTPALHVSVTQINGQNQFENSFYSFQAFFGNVVYDDSTKNASIVDEDEHGWLGSADLVVTCAVPAFGLLIGPKSGIRAALKINTTPENHMRFGHLGMRMAVFETGFNDAKRFFVCRDAPKLDTLRSSLRQKEWIKQVSSQNQSSFHTLVKLNAGHRATHLQSHMDFPKDSAESKALSTGAVVTVIECSPSTVNLRIGSYLERQVIFPFPIQGSQSKTRVARKSSWIEVEVPIFTALDGDRFDSWTQMVFESGRPPLCWSIPRVNLDLQPLVTFPKKADSSWLRTFMGTTLSDAEDSLNKLDQATTTNAKLDLKQSLNVLFLTFAGLNERSNGPRKTFQLALETTGAHTLIFATGIHHDLDLGSVVMEAYVVPFTIPRVKELLEPLNALHMTEPSAIRVSNDESILWKRMLPALAERCRTWEHKSTCEYRNKGAPLSTEEGKSPLCSCGEGKISGAELAKLGLKEWAPFAKYAVRVAIAPIFPVPYIESSMSDILKKSQTARSQHAGNSVPTSTGQTSKPAGAVAKCDHCGKTGDGLQVCGGCRKVRYCGPECQKAARKAHKRDCVRV